MARDGVKGETVLGMGRKGTRNSWAMVDGDRLYGSEQKHRGHTKPFWEQLTK